MTRCLFWNVERFNEQRFYSASVAHDADANMSMALSAQARAALLYRVIEAAVPDIIVIVETSVQLNPATKLAQMITAPVQLLNWLRTLAGGTGDPSWRLVPPLILAGTNNDGLEAIAVFYRGTTGTTQRFFTGPNLWPGGVKGSPQLPGLGRTGAPYGTNTRKGQNVDLNALLVPPGTNARRIPPNSLHNQNVDENTVAGRIVFAQAGGVGNVNFGRARPPFMVTFTEEATGGALRDLTLFGVHAPANGPNAAAFIGQLATVEDMVGPLGANETRLIGGDFNANLFDAAGAPSNVFDPLTVTNPYRQLLYPTAAAPVNPGELAAWKGYFGTHIVPTNDPTLVNNPPGSRFLWSDGATASHYPPYGCQSALYYSIDNVLIWPIDNARNYQTTIMNTVVSSPLSAVLPVPAGTSAGTVPIAADMAPVPPAAWPQAPAADNYAAAVANQLIAWQRYGHIYSTSDHFALFTDV